MASNIITDRINDIDVHAIVEHCHAHADESLPQGVLAAATSNLLDWSQAARLWRFPR